MAGAASPSAFLDACRGRRPSHRPVWFMRQAGRSLPEYRRIRGTGTILDLLRRPDVVAEITWQPVRRLGVDAAILYSDIVVPAAATGLGVTIRPGVGPVVEEPFRSETDLARLRPLDPDTDTPWVQEAVALLAAELPVPLIGFAGGPFTVASYLVEGGPSRDQAHTKGLMWNRPDLWERLMTHLADLAVATLRAQVVAGASAVQLFDSWIGALAPADYRRYVLPYTRRVFADLADLDVPGILFGVGTGELLADMAGIGASVVGVDWRVPLPTAAERVGPSTALQGNLDPLRCLAGRRPALEGARAVLDEAGDRPGHIFNLGHGVLPGTDPDVLAAVVDLVHDTPLA